MESKNKALYALGKTQKTGLQISQMFLGKDFYESKFLHLLILLLLLSRFSRVQLCATP